MYCFGIYYKDVEKNYDEMKKYYLMAIENGNVEAMCDLGDYYKHVENNYNEMKKYYMLAIKKGDLIAMENMGGYLKENMALLYKDFEVYYPVLDKLKLSKEHETNIRNLFLEKNTS